MYQQSVLFVSKYILYVSIGIAILCSGCQFPNYSVLFNPKQCRVYCTDSTKKIVAISLYIGTASPVGASMMAKSIETAKDAVDICDGEQGYESNLLVSRHRRLDMVVTVGEILTSRGEKIYSGEEYRIIVPDTLWKLDTVILGSV